MLVCSEMRAMVPTMLVISIHSIAEVLHLLCPGLHVRAQRIHAADDVLHRF